jgi:hypothetical protein
MAKQRNTGQSAPSDVALELDGGLVFNYEICMGDVRNLRRALNYVQGLHQADLTKDGVPHAGIIDGMQQLNGLLDSLLVL